MFKTSHTKYLESEIAYWKAEYHKLLNVVLPHQGFESLDKEAPKPAQAPKMKVTKQSRTRQMIRRTLENVNFLRIPGVEENDKSKSA